MNYQTAHTPIEGFISATPQRLSELGELFAPAMNEKMLSGCRRFYHSELHRDPTVSELRFLNEIVSAHQSRPEATLIAELLTNDREIAKTFADLMAKRSMLCADRSTPCSLPDVMSLAACAVGRSEDAGIGFSCRRRPCLELASEFYMPTLLDGNRINGFAAGYRVPHDMAALAEGDRVYAILKSQNSETGFEERIDSLIASQTFLAGVKRLLPIGGGGVFFPLFSLGVGFDASADGPYETLSRADSGFLLVVDPYPAADTLMAILRADLKPTEIGHLHGKKNQKCRLRSDSASVAYSRDFIESLFAARAYRAEIADGEADKTTSASLKILENETFSASCTDGDGSFYSAVYAALTALSSCIARGGRPEEITLTERVSLPSDPQDAIALGDCLGSLLGLYRVMTELSISRGGGTLCKASTASVAVYCAMPRSSALLSAKLVGENSMIYLLEPAYDGDLPNFEDLAKLYRYFDAIRRDGLVLSACAVRGDVMPALEKMGQASVIDYLHREPYMAAAGSILVEAKMGIQGHLLARTRPAEPDDESNDQIALEPLTF